MSFARLLAALLRDDDAAALVEYALVLGLLSAGVITALNLFGAIATTTLTTDGGALTAAGEHIPGNGS